MKELSTSGNPLQFPPEHVLSHGWAHIRDFLKTFSKQPDMSDETIEIIQTVHIPEKIDDKTNCQIETRSQEYDTIVNPNIKDNITLERSLSKSSGGSSEEVALAEILQER